jgi:hypothetical protein
LKRKSMRCVFHVMIEVLVATVLCTPAYVAEYKSSCSAVKVHSEYTRPPIRRSTMAAVSANLTSHQCNWLVFHVHQSQRRVLRLVLPSTVTADTSNPSERHALILEASSCYHPFAALISRLGPFVNMIPNYCRSLVEFGHTRRHPPCHTVTHTQTSLQVSK